MIGEGLFDAIGRFIKGPREAAPPAVRKELSNTTNLKVVRLQVSRQPLAKPLEAAMTWLSDGQWDLAKKGLRYDTVFHTGLVVSLANGDVKRVEKNEVLSITNFKRKSGEELIDIPLKNSTNMSELIANAEQYLGKHDLYTYHAIERNCQDFVMGVIKSNDKSIDMTDGVKEFVKQDSKSLGDNMGLMAKLASTAATNLAGRLNHAVYGSGLIVHS
jgi:hypothetical protein